MKERPKWRNEATNPYYERLLANREDPPENAVDRMSRAIRYAKEHIECYYEVRHVDVIIKYLDERGDHSPRGSGRLSKP